MLEYFMFEPFRNFDVTASRCGQAARRQIDTQIIFENGLCWIAVLILTSAMRCAGAFR